MVIGEFGGVQRARGRSLDEGGHISRRVQHRVVFDSARWRASQWVTARSGTYHPRFASRLNKAMAQPPKGKRRLFGGPHHHLSAGSSC